MHPARARELAHAGVDEREAGAPLLPGGEPLLVGVPLERAAVARLELLRRALGMGEQDVGVEVAPAQLAHPRGGAAPAVRGRALLALARRQAAPAQVGRQLRRPARQRVVALGVAVDTPVEPARERGARRLLAGRDGRLGHVLAGAERLQRRQPALAHAARQGGQLGRSAVHRAPLDLAPHAPERREDAERTAVARARPRDVDAVVAAARHRVDPRLAERLGDPRVARSRVGRDVARPQHRARARLPGERDELALGAPVADDEPAATIAHRRVELAQAGEHERGPRRRPVAALAGARRRARRRGPRGRTRRARGTAPDGRGGAGRAGTRGSRYGPSQGIRAT